MKIDHAVMPGVCTFQQYTDLAQRLRLCDPQPRFQAHDLQHLTTQKWRKRALYLQWQTDRKSCIIYRMVPFSMTLKDL